VISVIDRERVLVVVGRSTATSPVRTLIRSARAGVTKSKYVLRTRQDASGSHALPRRALLVAMLHRSARNEVKDRGRTGNLSAKKRDAQGVPGECAFAGSRMRPASLPIPRQNAAHDAGPMLRAVDSGGPLRVSRGANLRHASQPILRAHEAA